MGIKRAVGPKTDLMGQLIPEDEISELFDAWKEILQRWENAAPLPENIEIDSLPDEVAGALDGIVKDLLVRLAKDGCRSALKKLAWAAYCQFDPEFQKDWNDPRNRLQAAMVHRLGETDVFLTEYRDLRTHKEDETWAIQFQNSDGEVVQRERVFPMWGREHREGLDTREKALTFYRSKLKDRGIL